MYKHLVKTGESRPANGEIPSASASYANVVAKDGFPNTIEVKTLFELFERSAKTFPNNKCLGKREKKADGTAGPYVFAKYSEVAADVVDVASGLTASGVKPQMRVGIFGTNCPQWMIAMQACNRLSLHCVPLYDSLGENAIEFIIGHSELVAVFVASDKLPNLIKGLPKVKDQIKVVVYWGAAAPASLEALGGLGVKYVSWDDIRTQGKATPAPAVPPAPTDVCTIMYTSGTTGDPKGVVLTHSAVVSAVCSADNYIKLEAGKDVSFGPEDAFLSYLPLAHIFDRVNEEWFLYMGASIGYWQGDVAKLVDDMAELKPALFIGVPRVFDRIYARIMGQVASGSFVKRMLFNWGFSRKLYYLNRGFSHSKAAPFFDRLVFSKVSARLGGKVKAVCSGGAPLSAHVEEFLRVTMCAPVVQGYGLTETCAVSTCSVADVMSQAGTVGPPFPLCEIRLESVPDMNADALDAKEPKGEILLRGACNFSGYYKDEEKTKEAVDSEGWFHTGDIGTFTPEGALRIVDRKKNIFKLSQGEYVAVEKLESSYKKNLVVEQIWVYGNSFESVLLAVVVPNPTTLTSWAKTNGVAGDLAAICKDPKAAAFVLTELTNTGKAEKLRGFELIKAVHLVPDQWSIEDDLLTPTFKLKRPALQRKYQATLDAIYKKLNAEQAKKPHTC